MHRCIDVVAGIVVNVRGAGVREVSLLVRSQLASDGVFHKIVQLKTVTSSVRV